MSAPFVSILIPTRRPGPSIAQVLGSIFSQRYAGRFEVVIVDSGSPPRDLAAMRSVPARIVSIPSSEFGHGRTRNLLAEIAQGDVLAYLSQDAQPADAAWLDALVGALEPSHVAGAYARQVPRVHADPLTRFFLGELYGSRPKRVVWQSSAPLTFEDLFFSNVSSAIRKEVWRQVPFRADCVMSEDQYWAFDVLRHGFELRYTPEAQVFHSHAYSLRTLFLRNRLSGYSLHGLFSDASPAMSSRGLGFIVREARYLVHTRQVAWLPYMLLAELTRSVGFACGLLQARFERE
jgi:rhamnosyltransferase